MVYTCFLCKWRSDRLPRRSYHRFPSNKELKQKWLDILGKTNITIGKRTSLCSLHFKEECFRFGPVNGRKILKNGTLPVLHLTNSSKNQTVDSPESIESSFHTERLTDDVQIEDASELSLEDNRMKPSTELDVKNIIVEVPMICSPNGSSKTSGALEKSGNDEILRLKKEINMLQCSMKHLQNTKCQMNAQLTELKNKILTYEAEKKFMHEKTKSMVAKVYHYLKQEYEELKKNCGNLDLTPLSRISQRTAVATGVTETTVLQILKEEEKQNAVHEEPPEKRRRVTKTPGETDSSHNEEVNSDDGDNYDEQPDNVQSTQPSERSQNIVKNGEKKKDQLNTGRSNNVKRNDKRKERQQRYREQNREKLKQREAERRKRKQYLQMMAESYKAGNIRMELNNGEITDAYYQSLSGLQGIHTSSVQENKQAAKKNSLQKKRERQQRYREQHRERLKQREAERRRQRQQHSDIAEPSTARIEINNEEINATPQSSSVLKGTQTSVEEKKQTQPNFHDDRLEVKIEPLDEDYNIEHSEQTLDPLTVKAEPRDLSNNAKPATAIELVNVKVEPPDAEENKNGSPEHMEIKIEENEIHVAGFS